VPSNVGIPNPGEVTSCPLTTSPKKGCRPPEAGLAAGEVTFFRVGDVWWSRLLLLPVVRRVAGVLRGEAGAGCGRSRGFRLLNLYVPYVASLFGRAADAVEDTEALERLAASCVPALLGPLDRERTAGAVAEEGLLPGDRSNRSARAFTLFVTWGVERVGVADEAGPDTDLGVGLVGGGRTAPFAVG
jgi:hypothetical protein